MKLIYFAFQQMWICWLQNIFWIKRFLFYILHLGGGGGEVIMMNSTLIICNDIQKKIAFFVIAISKLLELRWYWIYIEFHSKWYLFKIAWSKVSNTWHVHKRDVTMNWLWMLISFLLKIYIIKVYYFSINLSLIIFPF